MDDYESTRRAVLDMEYMTFWSSYTPVGPESEGLRLGEVYRLAHSLDDRGARPHDIKRILERSLRCR